jgi:hypothetical protein
MAICTVAGATMVLLAARRGQWMPLIRPKRPILVLELADSTDEPAPISLASDATGDPTAAENQPERPSDRPAENGTDIVHEP